MNDSDRLPARTGRYGKFSLAGTLLSALALFGFGGKTTEDRHVGWVLWFTWVLANIVALEIGGSAGVLVAEGMVDSTGGWEGFWLAILLGILVSLIVVGPVIGILQWVVLKPYLPDASGWKLTSSIGYPLTLLFGIFGAGALVGLLHWQFILRRQVPRALWWPVASAVGMAGGWLAGRYAALAAFDFIHSGEVFGVVFAGVAAGAVVYGGVTGLALVLLLRRRPTTKHRTQPAPR